MPVGTNAEQKNRNTKRGEGCTSSLSNCLDLLERRRPPYLIPSVIWRRIRRLTDHIPLVSIFGFEVCLTSGRVDFAIRLDRTAINSWARTSMQLLQCKTGDVVWGRFLSSTRTPSLFDLWLEFDTSTAKEDVPIPAAFCSVSELFQHDGLDVRNRIGALASTIRGAPFEPEMEVSLDRVFAAIPAKAGVCIFGVMLSRSAQGMKVVLRDIGGDQIGEFLVRLGWKGDPKKAESLLCTMLTIFDEAFVSIDLMPELGSRIGLELRFHECPRPTVELRWEAVFRMFVSRGYCDRRQIQDLCSWEGFECHTSDLSTLPPQIDAARSFLGNTREAGIFRQISHAKVTLDATGNESTKIYFGARIVWI